MQPGLGQDAERGVPGPSLGALVPTPGTAQRSVPISHSCPRSPLLSLPGERAQCPCSAGAAPGLWQQFQQQWPGVTPGAAGGGEVGTQLAGSPSPGRRGPGRQQYQPCQPQAAAPCPLPKSLGSWKGGEGMGFVCWCPSVPPPHIPPWPGCARVHPPRCPSASPLGLLPALWSCIFRDCGGCRVCKISAALLVLLRLIRSEML